MGIKKKLTTSRIRNIANCFKSNWIIADKNVEIFNLSEKKYVSRIQSHCKFSLIYFYRLGHLPNEKDSHPFPHSFFLASSLNQIVCRLIWSYVLLNSVFIVGKCSARLPVENMLELMLNAIKNKEVNIYAKCIPFSLSSVHARKLCLHSEPIIIIIIIIIFFIHCLHRSPH